MSCLGAAQYRAELRRTAKRVEPGITRERRQTEEPVLDDRRQRRQGGLDIAHVGGLSREVIAGLGILDRHELLHQGTALLELVPAEVSEGLCINDEQVRRLRIHRLKS